MRTFIKVTDSIHNSYNMWYDNYSLQQMFLGWRNAVYNYTGYNIEELISA